MAVTAELNRGPTSMGSERTRRQLQELDDLLQQMLTLPSADPVELSGETPQGRGAADEPANRADQASAIPPPHIVHPEAQAYSLTKTLDQVSEVPSAPRAAQAGPKKPEPIETKRSIRTGCTSLNQQIKQVEPLVREPIPTEVSPPPKPKNDITRRPTDESEPTESNLAGPEHFDLTSDLDVLPDGSRRMKPPVAALYRVFLGINIVYDRGVLFLGPLGRRLSRPSARVFLGWAGLASLLGSGLFALAMSWGWLR